MSDFIIIIEKVHNKRKKDEHKRKKDKKSEVSEYIIKKE